MDFTEYTVEDFLTDDSFVSYCQRSDDGAVLFWESWLVAHPEKKKEVMQAVSMLNLLNGGWSQQQLDENFASFKLRIEREAVRVEGEKSTNRTLWPRIAVTAAAVAAIVFGVWFYTSRHSDSTRHPELVSGSQDIAPGKNTATLSINNGKAITLSEAKSGVIVDAAQIKYTDGSAVGSLSPSGRDGEAREGEPKTLTITTPRGGTYQMRLPDGTNVWLNAASSLTYTTALKERGAERVVKLSGEAYFEVAKVYNSSLGVPSSRTNVRDLKRVPFIVQTAKQTVEVLGTHFNINSYADEPGTKTTLIEGSVRVASLSSGGENAEGKRGGVILKPGQQALLSDARLAVRQADVSDATAWKDGLFYYKDTRLEDLMRQIARWYDVDVNYQDQALKNETFKGSFSRYGNVSRILKALEFTGVVKFKIEGKTITVMK